MAVASTGQLSQTLAQLRKRVAQRFGDYTLLTCTSNGTTTSLIDTINVNTGTEDMKGRVLLFSDGSIRRVLTQTDASGTLTFAAIANANLVESGDTVEVFNKRGKGFLPSEYKDAINAAINDAFPIGLIEVTDESGSAFDADTPEYTVDASIVYVHTVEWEDEDGFWHTVPAASRTNQWGWVADGASGQLRILGHPASLADGYTIRTIGYGRQDVLSLDADTCLLPAEWIIARACEHLALSALDKDPAYGQMVGVFREEAARYRSRLRRLNKGQLVRSL